jgi:hypothetical protein
MYSLMNNKRNQDLYTPSWNIWICIKESYARETREPYDCRAENGMPNKLRVIKLITSQRASTRGELGGNSY